MVRMTSERQNRLHGRPPLRHTAHDVDDIDDIDISWMDPSLMKLWTLWVGLVKMGKLSKDRSYYYDIRIQQFTADIEGFFRTDTEAWNSKVCLVSGIGSACSKPRHRGLE